MRCEICGRSIEKTMKVRIEGTLMRTCSACARFGEKVEIKPKHFPRRKGYPTTEIVVEFVEDYPEIIRHEREKKGLTQKQLGALINERSSVIARLEGKTMVPDLKLARKLEQALGVKILGGIETEKIEPGAKLKKELTLGDVVKIKKK